MKEYIEKLQEAARQLNTTIDNMWNHNEGISSMIPDRYIKAINVAQQNLYAALNAPSPVIDLSGVTKEGLVERMSAHALAIEAYKAGQQAGVSKPVWVKHLGKEVVFGFEGRKKKGIVNGYHPQYGVVLFVPSSPMIPYHYVKEELIEWLDETAQQAPDHIADVGKIVQGYNEQYKGWVALFKDEASYVQFLKYENQKQTLTDNLFGNCLQFCVARVINKPVEHVPNFMLFEDHWWSALVMYVGIHGYSPEYILQSPPHDGREYVTSLKFAIHSEGIAHAVVMKDGKVVYDPWPTIHYEYSDSIISGYYQLNQTK